MKCLVKWLMKKLPVHQEKAKEIMEQSDKNRITIARYKNINRELQIVIEQNHVAKHLIYDKGDNHASH